MKVPNGYYQFIIDYAPYLYYIPGEGVDLTWGQAAMAAAFAIDFLYEAYYDPQFKAKQTEINTKIVALADFILTQQNTNPAKEAYGGFKSAEASDSYYAIDACRVIPGLIRAYRLTGTAAYLNAAVLAGATFLYNMQTQPEILGVHDQYYGGFARAVDINDAWLQQMDIENLYGLIGLKMLVKEDSTNKTKYETMMSDLASFLRSGFEDMWLNYDPPPTGDGNWHRVGLSENEIYDDPFAYALVGLYDYEAWSLSNQKVYGFINTIRPNAKYPAYNPAICWAGYIDVIMRAPASDYYDGVTSGILWKIRKNHDKISLQFSMEIIDKHQDEFMFWGAKHDDYSYVENKQSTVTIAWLSLLFLNYQDPLTRFTQILKAAGENVILHAVKQSGSEVTYGEAVDIKALVSPASIAEVIIEAGYMINDYLGIHVFAPVRHHDKIRRKGINYEVTDIQAFEFQGETAYIRARMRRLLAQ